MYVCQGEGGINLSVYKRFKVCVYVHTYYNIINKKKAGKNVQQTCKRWISLENGIWGRI